MNVPSDLHCLFTATVEERDGKFVLDVPDREVELGTLQSGGKYRVAILSDVGGGDGHVQAERRETAPTSPPVTEGNTRVVEIEDLGEQGDGITRVERGFVVIVPDTEPGEKVEIEITDVRENLAFGRVVERLHDVA